MIRSLFVGAARCLFNLAAVTFELSLLFLYAAYRMLRAAVAKDDGRPVREAGFGALVAVVGLVKALQTQANRPRSRMENVDEALEWMLNDSEVVSDGERSAA